MAGNGHGNPVGAACLGHRAGRFRFADSVGDLRVTGGVPSRNLTQRLPDALLESGSTYVQRQIETNLRRLDKAHNLRDQFLEIEVASDQVRLRETILQVVHQFIGLVSEQNGADAFWTERN